MPERLLRRLCLQGQRLCLQGQRLRPRVLRAFPVGRGPQEVSGKGRVGASHTAIFIGGGCAGSQAAGGVCWAEGGSALCRSEGDTGVPRRPTQACRRPRPGTPGLGRVLLTSTSGRGAAGFPQPLRRFAAHPWGPVPTNPLAPRPPLRHRLGLMSPPAVASLPAR